MADGSKLKPLIIFKGLKNVPKKTFPRTVYVTVSMKGSMNTELMNKWKREVWQAHPGGFFKAQVIDHL